MGAAAATLQSTRPQTGTIEDTFDFSGTAPPLPQQFADLKREIVKNVQDQDRLVETWRGVLKELEGVSEEVASKGPDVGFAIIYVQISLLDSLSQIGRLCHKLVMIPS